MTAQPAIAVTGATGALGGSVARQLAERGIAQRLIVRNAERAPSLPGADVAEASYEDGDALTAALRGIETVFFVSGNEAADRESVHRSAVKAFEAASVRRVVYTSFLGALPDASFTFARTHHATEEMIRAAGLDYTFLRPSFYLDYVADWADAEGVIRGPAGDGRIAWVARDDLAEAAAAVLSTEGHDGRTYDLTGDELLTLEETATRLTEATGTTYRFENESIDQAYASRREGYPGTPDWELDGWVGTYLAIARGEMAVASRSVAELTGHRPRGIADFYTG
ncbi:SDR family oxidoreductase [Dietzia sp. PP-33]|jgi:NAD(P)H dehydrogenase (quinone)|uniref:SDR family oxidoreductase n=1 Tax=Dietzia sp. PP-33 TaxID=2957500 RepID=UPI0029B37177|nr:SDR family oxidoreductase [Dietzia sp. PP-33]MDX2357140.1 SDR family oxidoreductase [Dietzia sp. PP-33]